MTAHNKTRRWKGHCYPCSAHKDKQNPVESTPFRVLRQMGTKRRLSRRVEIDKDA